MPIELLRLLQLTSNSLPIGAFSYSEGVESLVEQGRIRAPQDLLAWLRDGLTFGSVRVDAAVMLRSHQATRAGDPVGVHRWNEWLQASRESRELHDQSVQMGRSLLKLAVSLTAEAPIWVQAWQETCHFPVAFGLTAALWGIDAPSAVAGYLHGWAANLVSAAVRLVPLGHTDGQRVLMELGETIVASSEAVLGLSDDELAGCNWGLALASMQHETLYSRLFRS